MPRGPESTGEEVLLDFSINKVIGGNTDGWAYLDVQSSGLLRDTDTKHPGA